MEKKHEKETKTRDERLRRAETDSKVQEKSIADLEKQINELKNEMNIRNETATTDSNKKTENIRDENEMMKNNIGLMQTEIVEKKQENSTTGNHKHKTLYTE